MCLCASALCVGVGSVGGGSMEHRGRGGDGRPGRAGLLELPRESPELWFIQLVR